MIWEHAIDNHPLDITSRSVFTCLWNKCHLVSLVTHPLILFFDFLFFCICNVNRCWHAASVQCNGRHSPDEAFGTGQQQPVDTEQWRGQQFFQRSRAGWSTTSLQARLHGSSQRTYSSLARTRSINKEWKEEEDQFPAFCPNFSSLFLSVSFDNPSSNKKEKKRKKECYHDIWNENLSIVCLFITI